jgi:hypothetical protein
MLSLFVKASTIVAFEIFAFLSASSLGFPAFKMSDLYLISLNRVEIDEIITSFYELNPFRKSVIQKFLSNYLDSRKWIIQKNELPVIDIFNTKLIDTINIERKIIEFENILHIEGEPGIGKSHLVEFLQGKFPNNLLYRFWLHKVMWLTMKDPDVAGDALYYLAADPKLEGVSGKFFNLTINEKPATHIQNTIVSKEIFKISEKLTSK